MLRLVTFLVVAAAVVGVVAEVALPPLVESRVEQAVEERVSGAARVEAETGDFPYVPGLLLDGLVDRLDVTLREVEGERITLATVALQLEGIEVDRSRLPSGEVEIVDLAAGAVLVEIEEGAISEALGVPVSLDAGMVEVAGRALQVVAPEGPSMQLPVDEDLLPCTPDVELSGPVVRLTCELDQVPSVLVRALEAAG